MEEGQVRRTDTGTPQGGVVSPVLCNVYPHRLDRAWDDHDGVLVRYADDLTVMCWSRSQAERALARLTELLAELGLEPKAAKTRIGQLEVGGEVSTFSASTTGWSDRRAETGNGRSCSSPVGPRTRPCAMPATGSGT
jgi:hypothetical protein